MACKGSRVRFPYPPIGVLTRLPNRTGVTDRVQPEGAGSSNRRTGDPVSTPHGS